jgi:hypothetical protein
MPSLGPLHRAGCVAGLEGPGQGQTFHQHVLIYYLCALSVSLHAKKSCECYHFQFDRICATCSGLFQPLPGPTCC